METAHETAGAQSDTGEGSVQLRVVRGERADSAPRQMALPLTWQVGGIPPHRPRPDICE